MRVDAPGVSTPHSRRRPLSPGVSRHSPFFETKIEYILLWVAVKNHPNSLHNVGSTLPNPAP